MSHPWSMPHHQLHKKKKDMKEKEENKKKKIKNWKKFPILCLVDFGHQKKIK